MPGSSVTQAARCRGVQPFPPWAFTSDPAARQAVTSAGVADSKNSAVFHSSQPAIIDSGGRLEACLVQSLVDLLTSEHFSALSVVPGGQASAVSSSPVCPGIKQGFDDGGITAMRSCQVQGDVTVPTPSCYICTSR